MKHIFYAVVDQDQMYVDNRCIIWDRDERRYAYRAYPTYENMVVLSGTLERANKMKTEIESLCVRARMSKQFSVKQELV